MNQRMTNEELQAAVKAGAINMAKLINMSVAREGADAIADFCIHMARKLYTAGYCAGLSESWCMAEDTAMAVAAAEDSGRVEAEHEAVTGPLSDEMEQVVVNALAAHQRMYLRIMGVEGVDAQSVAVVAAVDATTMPGGDA